METMSDELTKAATVLYKAAMDYKAIYIKENHINPVIWLRHADDGIFITDKSFTLDLIQICLNPDKHL